MSGRFISKLSFQTYNSRDSKILRIKISLFQVRPTIQFKPDSMKFGQCFIESDPLISSFVVFFLLVQRETVQRYTLCIMCVDATSTTWAASNTRSTFFSRSVDITKHMEKEAVSSVLTSQRDSIFAFKASNILTLKVCRKKNL